MRSTARVLAIILAGCVLTWACSEEGGDVSPSPMDLAAQGGSPSVDAMVEPDVRMDIEAPDVVDVEDMTLSDMGVDTPDTAADVDMVEDVPDEPLEPFGLPPSLIPEGDEFIVVVLPDTQIYAQRFPETFESQLRWIAERQSQYNIQFVTHVGDIVQTAGARAEWQVARAAFDWIDDIDLPHGFSMGGHDTSRGYDRVIDSSCSPFARTDCDSLEFKEFFGPARYANRPWYGGSSPSGISSYQVVEASGLKILFLHLPQDTPRAEVEWAGEILDANPGTLVHLTTHRYLFDYRLTDALPPPLNLLPAGRFNGLTYMFGGQVLMYNEGLTTDELWRTLIKPRPNVFMVHCGHVDAEFYQLGGNNDHGLPVYEVLVDYQNMADGGGGWLRILLFKPSENTIEVATFSTTTGALRQNGDGFDHAIQILSDYKDQVEDDLVSLGLTVEEIDALLAEVMVEDSMLRQEFFESLYRGGQRDSRFTLDVDFQAYINASR